jgi:signal transduction histidine kinase
MDKQQQIAQELAALLKQHHEEIALAWAEAIHQLPDSHYREYPLQELRTSTLRGIEAVVETLTTDSHTALEAYVTHTYVNRVHLGFDISEVIHALMLCRNAILHVLWRIHPAGSSTAQALAAQMDIVLRWAISHLSELYIASERRLLQEQETRTAMISDMIRVASSTLDLDEVLSHVADGIATAIGVQNCGFFLVDEEQGTITPKLEVTIPALRDTASEQVRLSMLLPRPLTTFNALFRQVVGQKEPSFCFNVQTDPRFDTRPLQQLGFKSVLAIPFVVKGRVVAVAYALTLEDCLAFTDEQIELARSLADAAALAIENARLYEQMEQLVVTKERARLSWEIHDDLAPTLGAIQLKASVVEGLLAGGQVEQARVTILELEDMISDAYTDVREAIFNLRAIVSPGARFLSVLREYLDDYRLHYGLEVQLEVKNGEEIQLDGAVQVQTIRIVQEMLTNVRKHAGTSRAHVYIERDDEYVRINVEDEGQGFDPARVMERDRQYVGLQVMRERAESIGGTLSLNSQPDKGTLVVLQVPLASRGGV